MYSLTAIIFNLIENYVSVSKTTINVKDCTPKLYLYERNKIQKIYRILTDITKKDKNFVSSYKQILLTKIENDSKYNNLVFGGFQLVSIGMFFVNIINFLKDIKKIIENEQYYQLILVAIPLIVSYWLLIGKVKENRIKTIIYYLTIFEENSD